MTSLRRALTLLLATVILVVGGGAAAQADPAKGPVVVIGAAGLSWSDLSPETTPALWSLTEGGVGSLVVRSTRSSACPADGWLAVNSGARASDVARPGLADGPRACRELTEPLEGTVPGWPQMAEAVAAQSYAAPLGLFNRTLTADGVPVVSIGPGAALALADANGVVDLPHLDRAPAGPELTAQVAQAFAGHRLVVIDAGDVRQDEVVKPEDEDDPRFSGTIGDPEQTRAALVDLVERRVASVLAGARQAGVQPTILLAGLADSGWDPALRVLALTGPDVPTGTLRSASTRQDGYVLTTDLPATVYDLLGTPAPTGVSGSPIRVTPGGTPAQNVAAAEDQDVHAQAVKPLVPTFFLGLVLVNLALYAVVVVGLKRPTVARLSSWWNRRVLRRKVSEDTDPDDPSATEAWLPPRESILRTFRWVSVAIAALPVSSFLANLIPWWRTDEAGLALIGATLAIAAVLTLIALAGPWRRNVLGPPAVIAGATALALAADIATGAHLQISAVMGVSALVGARFYGMNNTAFSLFLASGLLLAVAAANPLVRAGRRRWAGALVAAIGLVVTLIDVAPTMGADFGGPPAILPAFGLLALLAIGVRLNWKRVLLVLGGAAVASFAVAFLDWLRPADERTHLGAFFQTMIDGGLWPVVARKLGANLSILANNRPLTILALAGVATVIVVLARPIRDEITAESGGRFSWLSAGTPISRMAEQTPLLGPGLVALGTGAVLGFAVNDSGIAIPAIISSLAVPLLLAATATWMLGLHHRDGDVVFRDRGPRD